MSGINDGRVVIVTGAGRGIGRAHALGFAAEGAKVVINDLGGSRDGSGSEATVAEQVVKEIEAMGGEAMANADDVSSFAGAENLIKSTIDRFGKLDVLVNNAGILRDRMMVNMAEEEWDAVIKVHLKGTFGPSKFACEYWKEQSKAGAEVSGRIINTSSTSGIFGNVGQTNYGAAKAGIASLTVILAQEMSRYGVTVNAIAPVALTRMTEDLGGMGKRPPVEEGAWDPMAPENNTPVVVWLGSPLSKDVTGRVFITGAGRVSVAEGWRRGPTATKQGLWDPAEIGELIPGLVEQAYKPAGMGG